MVAPCPPHATSPGVLPRWLVGPYVSGRPPGTGGPFRDARGARTSPRRRRIPVRDDRVAGLHPGHRTLGEAAAGRFRRPARALGAAHPTARQGRPSVVSRSPTGGRSTAPCRRVATPVSRTAELAGRACARVRTEAQVSALAEQGPDVLRPRRRRAVGRADVGG